MEFGAGILFGIVAALLQSVCYLFSKRFVAASGGSAWSLFVLSNIEMGGLALVLLPFTPVHRAADVSAYARPLIGSALFYLLGQFSLFAVMKWTDASRVSPLLGLKILMLAAITAFGMKMPLSELQWIAVGLSVVAALLLNQSGGSLPAKALLLILAACLMYSLSDLSIVALLGALAGDHDFGALLLACAITYLVTAGVAGALACTLKPEQRRLAAWGNALPVAASWFLGMIVLYLCFHRIGAVFGNICQSLRGPFSILLGAWVAWLGHKHLEERVTRGTLARRLVAACLMCAAIGLFMAGKAHG